MQGGAEVDKANAGGVTPLLFAVRKNEKDVVKQLMAAGADPHRANSGGLTAWKLAALNEVAMADLVRAKNYRDGEYIGP